MNESLSVQNSGAVANIDPDALLTQRQAAQLLGLSERCLENWRSRGGGPPYVRISSRCIRYRRRDLLAFTDARVNSHASKDAK